MKGIDKKRVFVTGAVRGLGELWQSASSQKEHQFF